MYYLNENANKCFIGFFFLILHKLRKAKNNIQVKYIIVQISPKNHLVFFLLLYRLTDTCPTALGFNKIKWFFFKNF